MFKFLLISVFILSFSGGREAIRFISQNQELFPRIPEEHVNFECTCTDGNNFKTFTFNPNDIKFGFISSLFQNPNADYINFGNSPFDQNKFNILFGTNKNPDDKVLFLQNLIKSIGNIFDKPNNQNGITSFVFQLLNNVKNKPEMENLVQIVKSIFSNLNIGPNGQQQITSIQNLLQLISNYPFLENNGVTVEQIIYSLFPNLIENQKDYLSTKFQFPNQKINYQTCELPTRNELPYNILRNIPGNMEPNSQQSPNYEITVPTQTIQLGQVPRSPFTDINQVYPISSFPRISDAQYLTYKYPRTDLSTLKPTTGSKENDIPNQTTIGIISNGQFSPPKISSSGIMSSSPGNTNLISNIPGINSFYTTGTIGQQSSNPANFNINQLYPVGTNNGGGQISPFKITGRYGFSIFNPAMGGYLNPGNRNIQQLYPSGNINLAEQVNPAGITGSFGSGNLLPNIGLPGTLNSINLITKQFGNINPVGFGQGNTQWNPGMYQTGQLPKIPSIGLGVGSTNILGTMRTEIPNLLSNLPGGVSEGSNTNANVGSNLGNLNVGGNPNAGFGTSNVNLGLPSISDDLSFRSSLPGSNLNAESKLNATTEIPNGNLAGSGSVNPSGTSNPGSLQTNIGNLGNDQQISTNNNDSPGILTSMRSGIENGIKPIDNVPSNGLNVPSMGSANGIPGNVNTNTNINVNPNANAQPLFDGGINPETNSNDGRLLGNIQPV